MALMSFPPECWIVSDQPANPPHLLLFSPSLPPFHRILAQIHLMPVNSMAFQLAFVKRAIKLASLPFCSTSMEYKTAHFGLKCRHGLSLFVFHASFAFNYPIYDHS